MSETIHGACLCGRVTFYVLEPEGMGFCHCTRCQRWSGGSGLPEVEVAAANFKVTSGQELLKHYGEEGFSGVCFCSNCGSSLYAEGGEKYYVCAGVLQDVKLAADVSHDDRLQGPLGRDRRQRAAVPGVAT